MGHAFPPQQRPLLLLSSRPWNSALADRLSRRLDRPVESIAAPAQLTPEAVRGSKAKPLNSNAEAHFSTIPAFQ
jgi:hypothetical protein